MISLNKKISILKTSIIVFTCVLIFSSNNENTIQNFNFNFFELTKMIAIGAIAIPLLIYLKNLFSKVEIAKPKWSENPFNLSKPLIAFQFFAITIICQGFSMILNEFIRHGIIQNYSVRILCTGLGTYFGIYIALFISRLKNSKSE